MSTASEAIGDSGVPIVFFDGHCNFCNGSVRFITRRDPSGTFRFAPLQSSIAERMLAPHESARLDSLVLLKNNEVFVESSAALEIARDLSAPWPLLYGFIVVPRSIRDAVYRAFAKRRYRWFGRTEECYMPSPAERERFLV